MTTFGLGAIPLGQASPRPSCRRGRLECHREATQRIVGRKNLTVQKISTTVAHQALERGNEGLEYLEKD